MTKNSWYRPLRAAGLVVASSGLAAGLLLADDPVVAKASDAGASAPTVALDPLSEAFATTAAKVKSSVVYITATHRTQTATSRAPQMPELPPELREFFRFPGVPRGEGLPPTGPRRGQASGSGFVVSTDGYILTNSHVVDGASRVTVRLLDRREFEAKVVGTDPGTDVAVVKVDANALTPARLGDSDAARVGEWVLAVGNPLGERLTFTVTSGIVSAKGRALDLPNSSARSIQDFIQTDAAINAGNSGGPLVNVRGEVIGINTAIASPTGTYAGYGFAVPINLARRVMEQLIANGRVQRAALGVSVRDAGPNDAEYVGLPSARGVLVQDFSDDQSPAKRAGLRPGDVIVSVDGQPTDYVGQLQERIAFRKPGETVTLEVARKGGVRVNVRVPLESVVDDRRTQSTSSTRADDESERNAISELGVSVSPVSARTANQLGLSAGERGLVVTRVDEAGPADGRLVATGGGGPDVITHVEGTAVGTVAELETLVQRIGKGEVVTLRVYNAPSKTRRIERLRLAN